MKLTSLGSRTKALAVIGTVTAATAVLGAAAPAQATSAASYAAAVCGSGFSPDSNGVFSLDGGTIYVSYNGSTDCAVLMKSAYVGTATNTWVFIEHANGAGGGYGGPDNNGDDDGWYTTYAGPVYVYAPHECIEVGGGTVVGNDAAWPSVMCG